MFRVPRAYRSRTLVLQFAATVVVFSALGACSSESPTPNPNAGTVSGTDDAGTGLPDVHVIHGERIDLPLRLADDELIKRFDFGDGFFDLPMRDGDGLGPLYIRTACSTCHVEATRGPGLVRKMVLVESDGVTPSSDQSLLSYGHTERPYTSAGGKTPVDVPNDPRVKVTTRVGPPVLGRGYIDAILDSEIERVEHEQAARTDGIHGRINRVTFTSEANPETKFHAHQKGETNLIGRFGMKARVATVDDFTADAFQGDMGMTSPMRPTEVPNPDGLTDDARPGLDISIDIINGVADYMRLIEIPPRGSLPETGRALFEQTQCAACHVPSLKTRADYAIKPLAGIDAPVYTDLLLHDMGTDLADGMTDESAGPRDWKTAPLIGLRFFKTFLHDGRAKSIEEAIRMHEGAGSEANGSIQKFSALSEPDRKQLLDFVGAL